jgi:hypothetical protein
MLTVAAPVPQALAGGDRQASECAADTAAVIRLCSPSGRYLDLDLVIRAYEQLSRGDAGIDELCVLDAAAAQAEAMCARWRDDNPPLVSLLRQLAAEWAAWDRFGRADSAFERAHRLARTLRPPYWADIAILQQWAVLKLTMGDIAGARRFTDLQVETARADYARYPVYPGALIRALQFSARMLDRLGFKRDADAARYEALILSKLPNQCSQGCPLGRFNLDERPADDKVAPARPLPRSRH